MNFNGNERRWRSADILLGAALLLSLVLMLLFFQSQLLERSEADAHGTGYSLVPQTARLITTESSTAPAAEPDLPLEFELTENGLQPLPGHVPED